MHARPAVASVLRRLRWATAVAVAGLGVVAPAGSAATFPWGIAVSVEYDTVGGGYDLHDKASFEGGADDNALAWRAYSHGSGLFPCGDGASAGFEDRNGGGAGGGRFEAADGGPAKGWSTWNGESSDLEGDPQPVVRLDLVPEGEYTVSSTAVSCNGDRAPSTSTMGPVNAPVLLRGTLRSLARLPKGTVRRNGYRFVGTSGDGVTATYTVRVLAVKGKDPADRDHDLTPDDFDDCPDEPGPMESDGCPRDPRCTSFGHRAHRTWEARAVLAGFRDLDVGRFAVDVEFCTGGMDYARITGFDVSGAARSNVTSELLDFFFGFSPQYRDEEQRVVRLSPASRQASGQLALCFDWTWILGRGRAAKFIEDSMAPRLAAALKEAAARIGVRHDTRLWRMRFLKAAQKVFKRIAAAERKALEQWVERRARPLPARWRREMARTVGASFEKLAGPAVASAAKWAERLPDDTRNLLFGKAADDLIAIFLDQLGSHSRVCSRLYVWEPSVQVDVFGSGASNFALSGYRNPLFTWAVEES